MSTHLDIWLKRPNKIYREGDIVSGVLRIQQHGELRHEGISLTMFGEVTLDSNPKPIQLAFSLVDVCRTGKIPSGLTEIPFEIPLVAYRNRKIYETYHGVYVNIRYKLKCDIKRGFLGKNECKEMEFIVELPKRPVDRAATDAKPLDVVISPSTLRSLSGIPNFKIDLHLDSIVCKLDKPLTGYLVFQKETLVLRSVELQLVRVEACTNTKQEADRTEIQTVQIIDGNIPDNLSIPIYMPFPKLFSCPTILTTNFSVEFEVNFVITFKNQHLVNENISITLIRE
ncbi:hypothetical protein V9T40_013226 [Parthenolecanium corni]|uniref:Uncharacterized protein n=1 Tax=Parthenolecanium corni TaxID=536013 RepID=A0AAN9TKZ0_9HEMI